MVTRYYDYSVDDAYRIAVVEGVDERGDFEQFSSDDEIAVSELPTGFSDWQQCEAFYNGAEVHVMSADGA